MARVQPDGAPVTPAASEPKGITPEAATAVAVDVYKQTQKKRSTHAPLAPEDGWDSLELPNLDGLTSYRMSSLGGDLTQLVAGALKHEGEMPGYMLKYLQEGHDAENEIIRMFNEEFGKRDATYPELATLAEQGTIAGYDPVFNETTGTGGPVCVIRVGTTSVVKGHADRVVCVNPKSEVHSFAVVEAKKFRPSTWKEWRAAKIGVKKGAYNTPFEHTDLLEKYGWQVAALHHATGLAVYFVVGEFNPDTSAIDSIDIFMVGANGTNVPHSLAEIKARVMKAKKHVDAGEVPVCTVADETCPFAAHDFCPGKPEKEYVDVDDVELGRLLALYHAYGVDMAPTEDQKEAKKLREAVKQEIDKHLANKGHPRTKGDESGLMRVWSPTGDEFEFEWVSYEIAGRGATTGNKVNVKLVIEGTLVDAEDHPA